MARPKDSPALAENTGLLLFHNFSTFDQKAAFQALKRG
jgi:hypothetical protein